MSHILVHFAIKMQLSTLISSAVIWTVNLWNNGIAISVTTLLMLLHIPTGVGGRQTHYFPPKYFLPSKLHYGMSQRQLINQRYLPSAMVTIQQPSCTGIIISKRWKCNSQLSNLLRHCKALLIHSQPIRILCI